MTVRPSESEPEDVGTVLPTRRRAHGGREIETVGDAFPIEFTGALAAIRCAVDIQQGFAEDNANAPVDRRMHAANVCRA